MAVWKVDGSIKNSSYRYNYLHSAPPSFCTRISKGVRLYNLHQKKLVKIFEIKLGTKIKINLLATSIFQVPES
jgi:hypothetical protein